MDSKCKGNLTELQCLTAFVEQGCTVSIPYGDNAKYDFIVEIDKRLYKIQVKTSSLKDEGVIQFSCRSTHVNCTGVKNEKYSPEDVDFFATYWNGKCYIVPINESSLPKPATAPIRATNKIVAIMRVCLTAWLRKPTALSPRLALFFFAISFARPVFFFVPMPFSRQYAIPV